MSETLKPCPFCGGEAEMLTAESMNGGYLFGIMCNDCRSRGDVYDTEAEAIAAWNTRAAKTIGKVQVEIEPVLHGTLTAEKVRELMEDNSRQYPSPTDPYVWLTEYDFQAIADELNATLVHSLNNPSMSETLSERGTCTIERNESGCNFAYRLYTLSCGHTVWTMGDAPNYCPTCGRMVEQ